VVDQNVPTAPAVFECATLFANKPSVNGFVYSREIIDSIIEDFNARSKEGISVVIVVGDSPNDFTLDIDKLRIAAIVSSMFVHEDNLRVSCETIDTTAGHLLAAELRKLSDEKKSTSIRVFPIGQLKADDDKKVTEYNLSHFGVTAAEGSGIDLGGRGMEFNKD